MGKAFREDARCCREELVMSVPRTLVSSLGRDGRGRRQPVIGMLNYAKD